ncbi:MAG TPA: hypothetical protein VF633_09690 [Brevundimonas sp.]|jgi:hypothetical protein
MLIEPEMDDATGALDRALAEAVKARLAAGGRPGPDAEALALRDLLDHTDSVDQAALLRAVWGRISADSGPVLFAAGPTAHLLAADRHGFPVRSAADAEAALVEAGRGARALIDIEGPRPWWGKLLARPDLRIVSALPDDRYGRPRSVMVSRETSGPTGEDRTFWITDSREPDVRIADALAGVGLLAQSLVSAGGLKLFMLAGYVQAEDGRLIDAPGFLKGVIGAAPVF